jgi:hypothetical protein
MQRYCIYAVYLKEQFEPGRMCRQFVAILPKAKRSFGRPSPCALSPDLWRVVAHNTLDAMGRTGAHVGGGLEGRFDARRRANPAMVEIEWILLANRRRLA